MDAETLAWILAAGLATGVGGLALLAVRDPSERLLDGLLGFTAGIMLAATAFSLLVPALDRGTVAEVVAGFAAHSRPAAPTSACRSRSRSGSRTFPRGSPRVRRSSATTAISRPEWRR